MASEFRVKERYETFDTISWRGAFAGALVALISYLTLNLLGLGIGLSSGMSAGIWAGISGIIAFYIGGYYSVRSVGFTLPVQGMFQGFLTWGLICFLAFFVVAGTAAAGIATIGIPFSFEALSRAALWSFVGLVLTAAASVLGGRSGISRGTRVVAYPEEKERRAA